MTRSEAITARDSAFVMYMRSKGRDTLTATHWQMQYENYNLLVAILSYDNRLRMTQAAA